MEINLDELSPVANLSPYDELKGLIYDDLTSIIRPFYMLACEDGIQLPCSHLFFRQNWTV